MPLKHRVCSHKMSGSFLSSLYPTEPALLHPYTRPRTLPPLASEAVTGNQQKLSKSFEDWSGPSSVLVTGAYRQHWPTRQLWVRSKSTFGWPPFGQTTFADSLDRKAQIKIDGFGSFAMKVSDVVNSTFLLLSSPWKPRILISRYFFLTLLSTFDYLESLTCSSMQIFL